MLRTQILAGARNSIVTNSILLALVLSGLAGGITAVLGPYRQATGGDYVALVACGLVGALNIWLIVRGIGFRKRPETAPAARPLLARLGVTLDALSAQVEAELARLAVQPIFGGVRVLPSWLYKQSTFGFTLIPIDDVAWVHKKVTTRRVNFVPVSKTYSVVLYTMHAPHHATPFEFTAGSEIVDGFLGTIAQRVPWAIVGYNAGFAAQWARSRQRICDQIDARRSALKSPPATGSSGEIAAG